MPMTLKEARKLIQEDLDDESVEWNSPLGEAYKLSFEALKRLKERREQCLDITFRALPGETEE